MSSLCTKHYHVKLTSEKFASAKRFIQTYQAEAISSSPELN